MFDLEVVILSEARSASRRTCIYDECSIITFGIRTISGETPTLISMPHRTYYTYITASRSRTLYIGITSNIERRMLQHKRGAFAGFTADYRCNRLVWFERYATPGEAIAREKQIKGWIRSKKLNLIEQTNPTWIDLSEDWGKPIKSYQPGMSS